MNSSSFSGAILNYWYHIDEQSGTHTNASIKTNDTATSKLSKFRKNSLQNDESSNINNNDFELYNSFYSNNITTSNFDKCDSRIQEDENHTPVENATKKKKKKNLKKLKSFVFLKTKNISLKKIFFLNLLNTSILLVIQILLLFAFNTCNDTFLVNRRCLPQFRFEFIDQTNFAKDVLASARDVFKAVTFLANDMSDIDLNNNYNFDNEHISLIDFGNNTDANILEYYNTKEKNLKKSDKPKSDIDTFSTDNQYEISFLSYCRKKKINTEAGRNIFKNSKNDKFCTDSSSGVDIVSTLIRDSGIQIGEITKNDDLKLMGDSFVLVYEISLMNAKKLKKLKNNNLKIEADDTEKSNLDDDKMILEEGVSKALLLRKISRILPKLLELQFFIIVLSMLISFTYLVIIFFNLKVFNKDLNQNELDEKVEKQHGRIIKLFMGNRIKALKLYFIASLVITAINFAVAITLFEYIRKLSLLLKDKIGLAIIKPGEGYFLVWGSFSVSFSLFFMFLFFLFIK
ncbi:Sma2p ASCRUDRAFT_5369 [Ascoidea rubescens DSM 1968]|uniref:Uncharacterized protein n=1 Tax=Ascoidea rubescens DSM 1968 TaxID=1344418 RepID=A0A1D2VP28_9ASCO|nr:hypothetical protein ASCRUDRAFT_5369 [Ascoidea rubescens DSM 1968]ODV63363.1 hypothetical protein ASCRUDRAFT_5369 [Ascoidea rubescens DSM 1968]